MRARRSWWCGWRVATGQAFELGVVVVVVAVVVVVVVIVFGRVVVVGVLVAGVDRQGHPDGSEGGGGDLCGGDGVVEEGPGDDGADEGGGGEDDLAAGGAEVAGAFDPQRDREPVAERADDRARRRRGRV